MTHITEELANDWVDYARGSLASRITDTEEVTAKVLTAVQKIAMQLDDKQELESLSSINSDKAVASEILSLLKDVLEHLNSQDDLSQLIMPLYTALQFEDRTRQKLEGLLNILSIWVVVRNDNNISDEALANNLMDHVVAMEQQEILAKYFPDYIKVETVNDEIDFF